MDQVRRDVDGELCGYVAPCDGHWEAMTVFGARLSEHDTAAAAVACVLDEGLASLAERWTLRYPDGSTEIVCVEEAHPSSATLALDYHPMPGVPLMTISADQLASGEWGMTR